MTGSDARTVVMESAVVEKPKVMVMRGCAGAEISSSPDGNDNDMVYKKCAMCMQCLQSVNFLLG